MSTTAQVNLTRVESGPPSRVDAPPVVERRIDPADGATIEINLDPADILPNLIRALGSREVRDVFTLARFHPSRATRDGAMRCLADHGAIREAFRLTLYPGTAEELACALDDAGYDPACHCLAVDCPNYGDPDLGGYCGPHADAGF